MNYKSKSNKIPELLKSESVLSEHVLLQMEFLKILFPFLTEDIQKSEAIELRAVSAAGEINYTRNFWTMFKDTDIGYMMRLNNDINGYPYDLYFSQFTVRTVRKDGEAKLVRASDETTCGTSFLVMDFDNIDDATHLKYLYKINKQDVNVLSVATGHGYHDYILLNKPCYNKEIQTTFTKLLKRKGFPIDDSSIGSNRLFRVPYSYNCKCYSKESIYYEKEKPYLVTDISGISKHNRDAALNGEEKLIFESYDLNDLFMRLDKIMDEKNYLSPEVVQAPKIDSELNYIDITEPTKYVSKLQANLDYKLNLSYFPSAVQQMLSFGHHGYRNHIMLCLVPYFKNSENYTLEATIDIFKVWGEKYCDPKLDNEKIIKDVTRLYNHPFKAPKGKYETFMEERFGVFSDAYDNIELFAKQGLSRISSTARFVIIPDVFFELIKDLPDIAIRIYITLKYIEEKEQKAYWDVKEIMNIVNIGKTSFYKGIGKLEEDGKAFIYKINPNKKRDENYIYCLTPLSEIDVSWTAISLLLLEKLLMRAENHELSVYLYMYFCSDKYTTSWISQEELAKATGKSNPSISRITDSLHEKELILKQTIHLDEKRQCCNYTILEKYKD